MHAGGQYAALQNYKFSRLYEGARHANAPAACVRQVFLSTRPEKSVGSDAIWEQAESALRTALEVKGWHYTLNEADGAFYGELSLSFSDHVIKVQRHACLIDQGFTPVLLMSCVYKGAYTSIMSLHRL